MYKPGVDRGRRSENGATHSQKVRSILQSYKKALSNRDARVPNVACRHIRVYAFLYALALVNDRK
jgi:hypothetical protein